MCEKLQNTMDCCFHQDHTKMKGNVCRENGERHYSLCLLVCLNIARLLGNITLFNDVSDTDKIFKWIIKEISGDLPNYTLFREITNG